MCITITRWKGKIKKETKIKKKKKVRNNQYIRER